MPPANNSNILDDFETIVRDGREMRVLNAPLAQALIEVIDWLAQRVPYKTPLPRGYSLQWRVQEDADGGVRRYHQLVKTPSGIAGQGVWIDLANLDNVDAADVRAFAADVESGWLQEVIAFLQQAQKT